MYVYMYVSKCHDTINGNRPAVGERNNKKVIYAQGKEMPVNLQKKNTLCTLGALSASGLRNFFFLHRLIALYIDRSKAAHRHLDRRSL